MLLPDLETYASGQNMERLMQLVRKPSCAFLAGERVSLRRTRYNTLQLSLRAKELEELAADVACVLAENVNDPVDAEYTKGLVSFPHLFVDMGHENYNAEMVEALGRFQTYTAERIVEMFMTVGSLEECTLAGIVSYPFTLGSSTSRSPVHPPRPTSKLPPHHPRPPFAALASFRVRSPSAAPPQSFAPSF